MLREYDIVRVHFAGLKESVRIPDRVKNLSVMLEYGWNMPNPIPDLHADASGIFATLSFSGSRFQTFIPWETVFAITDQATGKGIVWPSEIPEGLLEVKKTPPPVPDKKVNHLRLVQ